MLVIWAIAFAIGAAAYARVRLRNPLVWLVYGAILGPVALAILALAPPGRCATCRYQVNGWARQCVWCGEDVAAPPPVPGPYTPTARRTPEARPPAASPALRPTTLSLSKSTAASAAPGQGGSAGLGRTALRADGDRTPEAEGRILASAIFAGGSAPLLPGARYILASHEGVLQVRGPLDENPGRVAMSRPLDQLDVTGAADRFVVTSMIGKPTQPTMMFTGVLGCTAEELEAMLKGEQLEVDEAAISPGPMTAIGDEPKSIDGPFAVLGPATFGEPTLVMPAREHVSRVPAPSEPAPIEPAPPEPAPIEPAAVEPAPPEPAQVEPSPAVEPEPPPVVARPAGPKVTPARAVTSGAAPKRSSTTKVVSPPVEASANGTEPTTGAAETHVDAAATKPATKPTSKPTSKRTSKARK